MSSLESSCLSLHCSGGVTANISLAVIGVSRHGMSFPPGGGVSSTAAVTAGAGGGVSRTGGGTGGAGGGEASVGGASVCNQSGDALWLSQDAEQPYSPQATAAFATAVSLMVVFTIFGNALVIAAVLTSRALRAPQNLFLVSLAAADILVATLIIPFSLANELMGYWYFRAAWCEIFLALDVLFCTSSIVHLCAISLDRYWSVSRAVSYSAARTPRRIKAAILAVWLVAAVISFPPLLSMNKKQGGGGEGGEGGSERPQCQLNDERWYILSSSVASFFAPCLIMILVYLRIYQIAKQRTRRPTRSSQRSREGAAGAGGKGNPVAVSAGDAPATALHANGHPPAPAPPLPQPLPLPDPSATTAVPPPIRLPSVSTSGCLTPSPSLSSLCLSLSSSQRPQGRNSGSAVGEEGDKREREEVGDGEEASLHAEDTRSLGGASERQTHRTEADRELQEECSPSLQREGEGERTESEGEGERGREGEGQSEGDGGRTGVAAQGRVQTGKRMGKGRGSTGAKSPDSELNSTPDPSLSPTPSPSPTAAVDTVGAAGEGAGEGAGDEGRCSTHKDGAGGAGGGGAVRTDVQWRSRRAGGAGTSVTVRRGATLNREKRFTFVLAVVIGVFVLCWFPFFFSYSLQAVCPCACSLPESLFKFFFWIGYCNSSLNPVIYTVFNKDFRQAFKKILCKRGTKGTFF